MPKFQYVAMDAKGKETKGTIDVANQNEAIGRIKEMGLFPTKVVEAEKPKAGKGGKEGEKAVAPKEKGAAKPKGKGLNLSLNIKIPGIGGKVKAKTLSTFTRQLATLVDAGLPLLRGLRVLQKQEKDPTLKEIVGKLAGSIEGGSTFSEALGGHPKTFDRLFVNMVKAGELGGVLEVVLNRLAEFQEKAEKIKGKVKAALFYPMAVLFVAVVIVGVLMTFVVPKFEEIFKDMLNGEPMPGFTQLVLGISNFIKNNILATVGIVVGIVVTIKLILKTKKGSYFKDKMLLTMPGLGPVVSKVAIARFSRTLGTLVSSGVPILQSLNIVKETAGNIIVTNAVTAIQDAVKEGEPIVSPMESSRVFPPMVISMVDVGEQTGALPEMLMKVADNYEEEVDNAVGAMTSLLEPVMIVFLAVVVGSIVIAMFLPLIVMMEKMGDTEK
ncbi:type II secretion system protein F [Verrucomicrobiota bacterium]|nr:type II secretion system protein F [Verrucomicrobiota bacterium]